MTSSNDNNRPGPVLVEHPEESASYVVDGRMISRLRDGRMERLAGAEQQRAADWIAGETGRPLAEQARAAS